MSKDKKASKNSEPQSIAETSPTHGMHPSRAELYAIGKSLRDKCPRAAHAAWNRAADRPDPIVLLEESNKGRIPELVPVRHGRMLVSPFTWYRGSALNMAADLAVTPTSGLRVQCCGDAHLCNFGAYATPERFPVLPIMPSTRNGHSVASPPPSALLSHPGIRQPSLDLNCKIFICVKCSRE